MRFKIKRKRSKGIRLTDNSTERNRLNIRMFNVIVRKGIININRKTNDSYYENEDKNQGGNIKFFCSIHVLYAIKDVLIIKTLQ